MFTDISNALDDEKKFYETIMNGAVEYVQSINQIVNGFDNFDKSGIELHGINNIINIIDQAFKNAEIISDDYILFLDAIKDKADINIVEICYEDLFYKYINLCGEIINFVQISESKIMETLEIVKQRIDLVSRS